jgi:Outer membrane protein beta-barrel domain
MKKYILLFGLLSLTASAFSQSDEEDDKKKKKCDDFFYLTAGLNGSGIGGASDSYTGVLLGLYLAAGLDILCLDEKIKFRTELAFSMQGSKYEGYSYEPGGGSTTNDNSVRLNYLALPVTAQYKTKKGLIGEAGFQPALLLSAKDKFRGGSANVRDDYNKFDLGLIVGAGYKPPKSKFGVGLRFVPGITNINNHDGPNRVKDHNWNLSLRLSYSL